MEHGTKRGYDSHRRRNEAACEECKAGKAAHERRMREARRQRLNEFEHPSNMAWDAGCRCTPCTEWHRARDHAYRARLSGAAA